MLFPQTSKSVLTWPSMFEGRTFWLHVLGFSGFCERHLYPKLASHSALTVSISQPEGKHPLAFVCYVSGSAWIFIIFLFHFRKLSVRSSFIKRCLMFSLYIQTWLYCPAWFLFCTTKKQEMEQRHWNNSRTAIFIYTWSNSILLQRLWPYRGRIVPTSYTTWTKAERILQWLLCCVSFSEV